MKQPTSVRVRYAETDQMGFAHHANYLVWFEAARTDFFRQTGKTYAEFEAEGVMIPLTDAECHYHAPAYYDELLEVDCRLARLTPTRLELSYAVRRDGRLLAEGRTAHAFLDAARRRPVNLAKRAPELWALLQRLALAEHPEREERRR